MIVIVVVHDGCVLIFGLIDHLSLLFYIPTGGRTVVTERRPHSQAARVYATRTRTQVNQLMQRKHFLRLELDAYNMRVTALHPSFSLSMMYFFTTIRIDRCINRVFLLQLPLF